MAEVTNKIANAAATSAPTTAPSTSDKKSAPGLTFKRFFTKPTQSAYDQVEWELRTASITDATGKSIFEQKDVEVPKDWSMTATNIVASKYLHGQIGTPERESGVRSLISRVADTIHGWGKAQGYFRSDADAETFHEELVHLLVTQKMAFNSPVWFNVGCDKLEPNSDAQNWHWERTANMVKFGVTGYRTPQCSACFINSVKDSLDSILTLAKTEGMLFKWGSGTGTNLSSLRSSTEQLSGGGTASGPLSFMRGFDAFAGVIKSGGKTRRAAKMVILNVDHPDIMDFIDCKMREEAKAWTLMQAGYDGSTPDSEAYSSIFFQNANNSVRVNDEFMHAFQRDADFTTKAIRDGRVINTYPARDIMRKIAEATWQCGDPGMQYDTTINKWHTSKNTARINASNPCSEYMFLDDSACNLASLNLMKFAPNGQFDVEAYKHAVDITITAQEILVDNSGYPTESIARNSHDYRPLGLGYANLGALLMAAGLPYDSDAGRDYAATLTAIMCGEAYLQSARIAEQCPTLAPATELTQSATYSGGACPGFYVNREPFLDVIRMHRASVNNIGIPQPSASFATSAVKDLPQLIEASKQCWDQALAHGERFGYRNSQMTVLAPTGTIGFMMDCDTTGIEPDLALVKYKKLVGGGMIKIVNNTVPTALFKLGYTDEQCNAIVSYIDATGTIEGAPALKDEHLPVFDCSFKPAKGTRTIHYLGHIKMMAAAQPFISGAISKTVNLPNHANVDDIAEAYTESWRLGLKAVAIYRDGSKGGQPLNVSSADGKSAKKIDGAQQTTVPNAAENQKQLEVALAAALAQDQDAPPRAIRHRLPDERVSITHKFNIGGHEGYINVGLYKNGQPGEIFIRMAKEGSTVSGLMDCFATATSIALQHGVPLKLLCEKFSHTRFEPSGWTQNQDLGFAKSIMDYIFRWLQLRFLTNEQQSLFAGLLKPKSPLYVSAGEGVDAPGVAQPPSAVSADQLALRTTPPQAGIAPEIGLPTADSRPLTAGREATHHVHAADALKSIIDLGDAPSCHVCGAIMTRNGSCYRCGECGSTSGCS
ncbi:MAG: Ribonucleoside-diphosphate reductase [Candidatus Angelobacter sp.]|jgi:ribonucleoside-diphosphate reductase alpha chain|nr:Ribonucleoside-diphosphate reductase [Candidatus Angelobacter sp.]